MSQEDREDQERADKFCEKIARENPGIKEFMDILADGVDAVIKEQREALADLGEAMVMACLHALSHKEFHELFASGLNPGTVFVAAYKKAAETVRNFAEVQQLRSRDEVLKIADRFEANGDSNGDSKTNPDE